MITARNYAAQAEHAMRQLVNTKKFEKPNAEEIRVLKNIANLIKRSVKFALPDEGELLNDGLKGLGNFVLHLPYPTITVEYYSELGKRKVVIVATEDDELDCISTYCIVNAANRSEWIPLAICNKFKRNKGVLVDGNFAVNREQSYALKFVVQNTPDLDKACESHFKMSDISVSKILELLEALSCRNVYTELLEPVSDKANKLRIKQGKLPLYKTKILVVDSKPKEIDTTYYGGSHASPRQHLRRGHIRRYDNYSIWINNCIVGKAENGVISKSYEVK